MKIEELQFFPTRNALKYFYKERDVISRIGDLVFSILRAIKFIFNLVGKLMISQNKDIKSFSTLNYGNSLPKKN